MVERKGVYVVNVERWNRRVSVIPARGGSAISSMHLSIDLEAPKSQRLTKSKLEFITQLKHQSITQATSKREEKTEHFEGEQKKNEGKRNVKDCDQDTAGEASTANTEPCLADKSEKGNRRHDRRSTT